MSDPLRDLDEYDRRHLTSHLVAARRTDDLHRLLALEVVTAEGSTNNAWYRAKVEADDASGFTADVDTACTLAELVFATGTTHERAEALGLECRYALIAASLNSLTENLPPNVLASLLEHRIRTPRAVLSIIEVIPDPQRQALSLTRLTPQLVRAGLEDEVVGVVVQIDDEASRADALAGVVLSVSAATLPGLMPTVRAMTGEGNKARVFAALADREDVPEPVLATVLEEASGWKNEHDAAHVLTRIAPRLGAALCVRAGERAVKMRAAGAMAEVVGAVAPRLGERGQELLDTALTKARRARSRTQRVQALSALGRNAEAIAEAEQIPSTNARIENAAGLAAHLSPGQLTSTLDAVLATGGAQWKAIALAKIAPHVPAHQWSQVLRKVSRIEVRDARASALAAIAPHVPSPLVPRLVRHTLELPRAERQAAVLRAAAPRLDEPELAAVLAKAKRMRRHGDRGTILAAVAPYLSESQADEALTFVRRIASVTDRALAIDALAARLSGASIEQAVDSLDINDYAEALPALAALAVRLPHSYLRELFQEVFCLEPGTWSDSLRNLAEQVTIERLDEAVVAVHGLPEGPAKSKALVWLAGRVRGQPESTQDEARHAEFVARLQKAAPLLAEARATTIMSPPRSARPVERQDETREENSWLRVAGALLPNSLAVSRGIYGTTDAGWPWERDADAALEELTELLVEVESFDDAVAAASAISDPLQRSDTLARLAPMLRGDARVDAISSSFSSAVAAETISLLETSEPRTVHLTGIGELARRTDMLTADQREQLAGLIMSRELDALAPARWHSGLVAAHCSALAELVPDLEDPAAAEAWALHRASSIKDDELRAFALARLVPVIQESRLEDCRIAAKAIQGAAPRSALLVVLARRSVEEGRLDDAIAAFAEACAAAQAVTQRDDRGQSLSGIANFAADYGKPALDVLWGTDEVRPPLLRRLSSRGRRHLLSDLVHLTPALDAVSNTAVAKTFRAIQDVREWWP